VKSDTLRLARTKKFNGVRKGDINEQVVLDFVALVSGCRRRGVSFLSDCGSAGTLPVWRANTVLAVGHLFNRIFLLLGDLRCQQHGDLLFSGLSARVSSFWPTTIAPMAKQAHKLSGISGKISRFHSAMRI
jgi:hypothetical protein